MFIDKRSYKVRCNQYNTLELSQKAYIFILAKVAIIFNNDNCKNMINKEFCIQTYTYS